MRHFFRNLALILALPVAGSLVARADTLILSLTGTEFGTDTTVVQSNPTPVSFDLVNGSFVLDLDLMVGNTLHTDTPVTFTTTGLTTLSLHLGDVSAPFWTGTPDAPTFILGTYTFADLDAGHTDLTGTLSILPPAPVLSSTTPEPASLILLGTGAAGLCGMLRSRLRRV